MTPARKIPHSGRSIKTISFRQPPITALCRRFGTRFFCNALEEGGWTRQVNQTDFRISTDVAEVTLRLTSAAYARLHWHAADELALMLTGNCRLTAIDFDGSTYVNDVKAGNLWYFPTGIPHPLQGLEPDGCEFLLVFDDGSFSEDNTTLLSD